MKAEETFALSLDFVLVRKFSNFPSWKIICPKNTKLEAKYSHIREM